MTSQRQFFQRPRLLALNSFVDDFGGGALTSVSSATLDANAVADELADYGAEIKVAENFPTDTDATVSDPR